MLHECASMIYSQKCPECISTSVICQCNGFEYSGTISFLPFSTVTSFPDGHFTMSALDRLELAAGISIYNQLAPKFLTIASALCLDDSALSTLSKSGNNPHKGLCDVLDRWLSGKSPLPPTWQVLLAILRDIKLEELAQEIDDFFNVNSTSLPAAYRVSCIMVHALVHLHSWSSFSAMPSF